MNVLEASLKRLAADFSLTPVCAGELEFYLQGSASLDLTAFWQEVREACEATGIVIFKIEKERGREQHEVALACVDALSCVQQLIQLKDILASASQQHGMHADFRSKPYPAEPGSGLHFHIHLADTQGHNVFWKQGNEMSPELRYSLGGILKWLAGSMPVFAPLEEDYARFTPGSEAPTTVSWGANNRTVALRLPDSAPYAKRIEHRVCGANADPAQALSYILAGMHDGLTRKLEPGEQIYGDASLDMYALPKLPRTLAEAQQAHHSLSF